MVIVSYLSQVEHPHLIIPLSLTFLNHKKLGNLRKTTEIYAVVSKLPWPFYSMGRINVNHKLLTFTSSSVCAMPSSSSFVSLFLDWYQLFTPGLGSGLALVSDNS